MNLGDLHKVWEIEALKKPGEEKAKKMLEKLAKQVQPIMRKHKWSVKLLSEFCPNNPALLGLNVGGGVHVKLRLRRPNRDWDFFPFDQVLDTMLHELCHNVHGPHNANFYKLWDELRKECEELLSKGITGTGEGFDLPGRRLGGFSRQPPPSSLRKAALDAAEKRAKLGSMLPSGPKRLGGDTTIMVALSPIQAAAMAAERRLQDEIWCGSQSAKVFEEGESSNDVTKDLLDVGQSTGCSRPDNGSKLNHDKVRNAEEHAMWECGVCTLLNPSLAPICKLCSTERPKDVSTKYKSWSCKFCTLNNSVKLDKCSACSQWRYSYGPPVSTRTPNLGT
ncbi:DNA-dependent metalloprotease WSS1 isoform X2 [Hevea brasiliensis]|uniref:DNA-dependent metalloprotease WSS1 isoform X2 n=1 Tax=Hevea brasiliensis TaxID=3981 RepID=UPI0025EF3E9A|nr:DNA-dependent metalloprotease WSS1 isoform X2 [Hevea brasiliensis]